MGTKRRYRIHWTLGIGVALSGLAASTLADPAGIKAMENAAENAAQSSGLMSFPNVRVVNAPIVEAPATSASSKAAAVGAGMRAYLDPQTGELQQGTSEEAAALTNASPASSVRTGTPLNNSAAAADSSTLIYGPGNAVGAMLGEETMVFQVAHQDADGNVVQHCITGKSAAEKALTNDASAPLHAHEESHHEH